jgi:transcription elongation factor GreA
MLLDAEIIDTTDTGSISPGHTVALRCEGDDDAERYLIGSSEEKGGKLEVLTPGSPLGRALLGATVGDWVEFESPTGAALKVEVVEIEA